VQKKLFFTLIPKGPRCIFWQHRNFGLFTTNGVFILFLWNFHKTYGHWISLRHNNFHNFQLHGPKVIVWYVVFFTIQAILVDEKKSHFLETKIWNRFCRFIYMWKALNNSIFINEMKVMKSFCWWQLRIPYSKNLKWTLKSFI